MVEWKKIGELSKVLRGKRLTKNLLSPNAVYPVFHGGLDPLGNYHNYNRDENTVMIINVGASAGTVGFCDKKFWSSDGCYCISHSKEINNRFLYFFLLGKTNYLQSQVRYAGIPTLDSSAIEKIEIPVLSLVEQQRIVSTLDTFTETIDNIKQQIEQRKQQYHYYREQLLSNKGYDRIALGKLCEMERGNGVQKTDFIDEGIGCIHYGQIYTHYGLFTYTTNRYVSESVFNKARKASKGDVIMTATSENIDDVCKCVAYLGENDIAVSNHAIIIKHTLNPKFLAHCSTTYDFYKQKYKLAHGAKVVEIKPEKVALIEIPVPSIEEQNRIVGILDNFEAVISNLEAQLAYRQKQYEYYRNKLLTFE